MVHSNIYKKQEISSKKNTISALTRLNGQQEGHPTSKNSWSHSSGLSNLQ